MKKKTKKEREEFLKKQFFAFELFEKMAQDNLRIHKKANSRLKNTKVKEYYKFFYEFYFKIDTNIVELSKGLKLLFNKHNLMPAVFLLRGLSELIFFNIYVAFKSHLYVRKNDINGLVDLILKASMATGVETLKSKNLKSESAIFNKIITKYQGRRLHINDCIRFFKKKHIEDIIKTKENTKIGSFRYLENAKKQTNMGTFKFEEMDIDASTLTEVCLTMDRSRIIQAYDKMCEIIHPTAIKIYDATDLKIQDDYAELFHHILDSGLFMINIYAIIYKLFLCRWFLENQDEFIKTFNNKLT